MQEGKKGRKNREKEEERRKGKGNFGTYFVPCTKIKSKQIKQQNTERIYKDPTA